MEILMVMLLPSALLGIGLFITYRYFPVTRFVVRYMRKMLRWLFKERHLVSGAGRIREPRVRYQDYEIGGEER